MEMITPIITRFEVACRIYKESVEGLDEALREAGQISKLIWIVQDEMGRAAWRRSE